jgi:hypothetical protein
LLRTLPALCDKIKASSSKKQERGDLEVEKDRKLKKKAVWIVQQRWHVNYQTLNLVQILLKGIFVLCLLAVFQQHIHGHV